MSPSLKNVRWPIAAVGSLGRIVHSARLPPSHAAANLPAADPEAAREIRRLSEELDRLAAEVRRLSRERLVDPAIVSKPFQQAPESGPARSPAAPPQHGPSWYLEQYALSFEGGGTGSEYFRLAVDAYARELVAPIVELERGGSNHISNLRPRGSLAGQAGGDRG